MLQATQQQLQVIAAKTHKLESSLQGQIEELKTIKEEKAQADAEVVNLRQLLAEAEQKAEKLHKSHDDATQKLKASAMEYSKAQLLQKKYQNTLSELQGNCRSVVRLVGGGSAAAAEPNNSNQFVVADECTVNAVTQRKSFIFDGVIDEHAAPEATYDAVNIDAMVTDCLAGYNTGAFSFGPSGGGKSDVLFGNGVASTIAAATAPGGPEESASMAAFQQRFATPQQRSSASMAAARNDNNALPPGGVAAVFLRTLFGSLEANEVTHFNMRLSFAELEQEHIIDLLSEFGDVVSFGGAASDVRSLPVHSLGDALQLLKLGMDRYSSRKSRRYIKSHLFFNISIENFNSRGHFRRATAMFADLSGVSAASVVQQASPEGLWVSQSVNALCDIISARAAAANNAAAAAAAASNARSASVASSTGGSFPHPNEIISNLPATTRNNPLIKMLGEVLVSGNCRAVMICCVNTTKNTPDEILAALTYAYHFKAVRNNPVPYDIPPELQRLHMEMNEFDTHGMGGSGGGTVQQASSQQSQYRF